MHCIYVPILGEPLIESFSLTGKYVKKFGAAELLIPQACVGAAVSDVVDGIFHFYLKCSSHSQIHSYTVSQRMRVSV